MMFRSIVSIISFVISVVAFSLVAQAEDAGCYPDHLYLTRHTEKLVEEGNRDPGLSEAGIARSHALVKHLEGIKMSALISSQYNRTRDTLKPLAKANGLNVQDWDVRDAEGLIKKIRTKHCGENLIISGHSNTVPSLIRRLGVTAKVMLDDVLLPADTITILGESHYGTLFTITWANGEPSISATQYGD